jgi:hypothetical protein
MSDESDKYYGQRLSEEDYNYWRHLAREFALKEELKEEDKDIPKREWEAVQTITEEIEHEKKVLRQLKVCSHPCPHNPLNISGKID